MNINVDSLMDLQKRGVYEIRNSVNGKIYIGSTISSFKLRWRQHISKLRTNKHENAHLQSSYNKYGEESFVFSILYISVSDADIRNFEQKTLDSLHTYEPSIGYNLDKVVDRSIRSEQTKRRISISLKGKRLGELNGFYGKTHSQEVRNAIRLAHLGKHHSEETRCKMSEKRKIKVRINNVIYPSIKEAALALNMSKATLSRWIKKGKENYEVV